MIEQLYRGFIKLKDKKAIEEFKDNYNLSSYETARRYSEYAGVLADHVILIDVDDFETSEILLKIIDAQGIQSAVIETGRGKHFMFYNTDVQSNKTKTNTPIGLKVDVKLGSKNSYQVLKHNGVKRPWIRKPEELDELPRWLLPMKSNVDFAQLTEGDGRNQTLFNYILQLQSNGFTKAEITETINIINQYVLKEPLKQREVDVILRDDAFKKQAFFKGSTFLHHAFANYLQRENHIIKLNRVLHIYKDGIYTDRTSFVEAAMISHIPQLTQARRREALSYLEIIAPDTEPAPAPLIALGNVIVNIRDGSELEYSPEIVIKNRIKSIYNSNAHDPTVDAVLTKIACGDRDLRQLLEEVIGYTLFRRNELGKCFILTGGGSNGKSTLIDMIKHLLGSENYSSLSFEELGHRFKTPEMFGKLANLGDDISSKYIEDNSTFKKLVTGETVNVERKGKDPFEFDNYAKLIFSANEMPRINDTTDGLMRRLIIIPFNAKFSAADADFDPYIKDKLLTDQAMQYFLKIALDGLKRVLSNKRFTLPDVVRKEMRRYEEMNNPVLSWLEDDPKINNEITRDVYLKYSVWCHESGLKPLGNIQFSREICKSGYVAKSRKIDGKKFQVFEVQDGTR